MQIAPFAVEEWMNAWETRCTHNLAETCVHSLRVDELLALCGQTDLTDLQGLHLTYGDIPGSPRLRAAIAARYDSMAAEAVLVTHGTIGANMLVHKALVEPGDRVIAIAPTYQQHVSIPQSLGADLHILWLREEDGWLPDLDALRALAAPGAKLIALTNPNNPTGALIPPDMLRQIASIAEDAGAWLLADEVYRGLDQTGDGSGPSVADLTPRGISTCGMSKAYALAGLRVGWVAGPDDLCDAVMRHRDYDTISVGRIDDHLAALALENAERLLGRSRQITQTNLALVDAWVRAEPRLDWVRPSSGTTGLIRYDLPMGARALCLDLLQKTGVLLTPGDAFDLDGYVRIGFANPEQALRPGLAALSDYLSDA